MGLLKRETDRLRLDLRRREIETVFQSVPYDTFEDVLELGAGDGAQSRIIAKYAKKILSTDVNDDRLVREPFPGVSYDICNVEKIEYDAKRFDLVYSSNLLEHIRDPSIPLLEMRKVMRDDGLMIHVIPNRFWKLLHIGLFYPNLLLSIADFVASGGKVGLQKRQISRGNNLGRATPSFLRRNLWPTVHGEYDDHLREFLSMGSNRWMRIFKSVNLEVVGTVTGLPAHSPYRFGMERIRKICEGLGLSSCNGYVLKKSDKSLQQSPHIAYWS